MIINRDTVQSVGLVGKKLPFTVSNNAVRSFRHALALDERRAKFHPSTFRAPTALEEKLVHDPTGDKIRKKMAQHHDDTWLEEPTDVEEVWFAGCHCGALFFRWGMCGLLMETHAPR